VEVKADVHTAVQKHSKYPCDQLTRILAVVANRTKKDLARGARKYTLLAPAVSIVNATQWLEIFSTRTGRNYYKLGFWLFIDGLILTPEDIKSFDRQVWKDASGNKPYPDQLDPNGLQALEDFFKKNKDTYGSITSKFTSLQSV
jgi:hypothetical protein